MTSKLGAVVDALGNPMGFTLVAGQVHDCKTADVLLAQVRPEALLGDKAFDVDALLDRLAARNIKAVIPPKRSRKLQRGYDKELYKERNLIERFFNKLKQYRGIATRYDKLAVVFLAGVHLAASVILLK